MEHTALLPFEKRKSFLDFSPAADYGESSYMGHERLIGRSAVITGADSGIGRAVALCFAKEGADILFTLLEGDADEQKDAEETIRLVEATGRKVVAVPGDIRRKSFCEAIVKRTVEEFGRLHRSFCAKGRIGPLCID